MKIDFPYQGIEQGPIRPPSEAHSLFIRVTRNCPWNQCTFCPLYKDEKFSIRPVEDIKRDIDTIACAIGRLQDLAGETGELTHDDVHRLYAPLGPEEQAGLEAALHWFVGGMASVFLQDANSLVVKPPRLIAVLTHLKAHFPWIQRITSYARSQTIAKIEDEDLRALREAGLNRLHIGMESGSDTVLQQVKKGATKAIHISAGRKVIQAGMELSEYYMPGLGGQDYSREHALESADALNRIGPHFIRLRTLAIPRTTALFTEYEAGRFRKCTDRMVVAEIRLFLQHLEGIDSIVKSDHSLNLFPTLEGRLPGDKARLLQLLDDFLAASPERQRLYQVGRRCGLVGQFSDLDNPAISSRIEQICRSLGVTAATVDSITDALMQGFI
ncbi:MAG: radical SAM protein [Candidatus Competibacteraceae bacterium]